MLNSPKKIGFHIAGMTDIRYFYPLISIMKHLGGYDFYIIVDDSNKYTSILNIDHNISIFLNIFENMLQIKPENFIILKNHIQNKNNLNIDVLFSMSSDSNRKNNDFESGKYFTYKRRIIFQHGFDYLGTKKGARSACEKTCYVLNDWIYANDIKDRFNQKVSFEIPDIPVQYWNYEEQIDYALSDSSPWKPVNLSVSDKIAFILYPEVGKHEIVLQHVKILLKNNYKIFVKQRRKSQGISKEIISHDNVFPCFDDLWLPSEAVIFPLFSNVCIGYGSAGYADISSIKKPYIDFALTSYSKRTVNLQDLNNETGHSYSKLSESGLPYQKPDHIENYYYSEEPKDFEALLENIESNYSEKNAYLRECKNKFDVVKFIDSITTF